MSHVRNVHHGNLEGFFSLLVVLLQGRDVLLKLLAFCDQCIAHILLQLSLHLGCVLVPLLPQ